MRADQFIFLCFLALSTAVAAGADEQWHTSPDKWTEPRNYHRPFEERFASRISLDHIAVPDTLPELHKSDNDAYWFAVVLPDKTKQRPWNTEILVYNERDYLLRVQLGEVKSGDDVSWITEKLLHLRVWWGTIGGADFIIDVEREKIIHKEMVWFGAIPFFQFQEAKKWSQSESSANESKPKP